MLTTLFIISYSFLLSGIFGKFLFTSVTLYIAYCDRKRLFKICSSLTNINSVILHEHLQISLLFYVYVLSISATSFLTVYL